MDAKGRLQTIIREAVIIDFNGQINPSAPSKWTKLNQPNLLSLKKKGIGVT